MKEMNEKREKGKENFERQRRWKMWVIEKKEKGKENFERQRRWKM